MFKNLTYKQKNFYLIGVSIVFLLIVYFFAIDNTVELYYENQELKNQLELVENAPAEIANLRGRLLKIETKLIQGNSFNQERILEKISSFTEANNLILQEFPSAYLEHKNDYIIQTNKIKISGNFINLLKLAYYIEQKEKVGRIASLQFNASINRRTRKLILTSTMYLQNIEKIES